MGSGWLLGHRLASCRSCFFVSSTCVSRALLCGFYVGEGGGAGPDRAFRSKIKPKTRSEATKGRPGAGAGGTGAELSGVTRTRQGTVQTTGVPPLAGLGGRACLWRSARTCSTAAVAAVCVLSFPNATGPAHSLGPAPWGSTHTHAHTHITPKHTKAHQSTHTTVGACLHSHKHTHHTKVHLRAHSTRGLFDTWISGGDVNSFCCHGLVHLLGFW